MAERGLRKRQHGSLSRSVSPPSGRKKGRADGGDGDDSPNRTGAFYKPSGWGECIGPDGRIVLKSEIGKGTSSTVFRCTDAKIPGKEFAVKIIRLSKTLREATEKEIRFLRRCQSDAASSDAEGKKCLLGLASVEVFDHEGHLALVSELQKCCLKTALLKYGQGRGLPLAHLQFIARDIFLALRVLRKINIIHCDLKPANLLVSLDGLSVKLGDFGSAVYMSQRTISDQLQPVYYRAPEVILGQSYGAEIDIWSAGLSLYQLATGHHFMTGPGNNAMIHAMLTNLGAFPHKIATAGKFSSQHFNSEGSFRHGYAFVPMTEFHIQDPPFLSILQSAIQEPPASANTQRHVTRLQQLADLLAQCIVLDPAKRVTPEIGLEHVFVQSYRS